MNLIFRACAGIVNKDPELFVRDHMEVSIFQYQFYAYFIKFSILIFLTNFSFV